jgi:hypothetical protein
MRWTSFKLFTHDLEWESDIPEDVYPSCTPVMYIAITESLTISVHLHNGV